MKKNLDYNLQEVIKVKNERIAGFILACNAVKDDGAGGNLICDIADLNQIGIDVYIKRKNGKETIFHEGYLEDLLVNIYGQTTMFEIVKAKTGLGYLFRINFAPDVLELREDDELIVKVKADKKAFTGMLTGNGRSTMVFETIATSEPVTGFLPVSRYQHIGNDKDSIDMMFEPNVIKITALTDLTADYLSSQKAKITDGTITAQGNFEKVLTPLQMLSENYSFFNNNPESPVQDLVTLWTRKPLNGVRLRAKLDQLADKDAKVLTLHRMAV